MTRKELNSLMREFAEALYRHCEAADRAGLVRKPINSRFN